jgi:aldehyde:ferredoxin oxidoreductase
MKQPKILRVDLSNLKIEEEEINEDLAHKYVGGKGLVAYYMYKEIKQGIDPFSPENKIFIFNGPLAFIYPTFTKIAIGSKSPLTGTFADAYAGGSFAVELRRAGYIGIIIEGRSDQMICLKIAKGENKLINCENLRGKTTYDVGDYFTNYSVLTIGPAGENLVRYAAVFIDMRRKPVNRPGVAGRGGIGAVMGSKNLKAILVRGWMGIEDLAPKIDSERRSQLISRYVEILKKEVIPAIGLGSNLPVFKVAAEAKILPVKNFRLGIHDGWEELTEDGWRKAYVGRHTCPTCPVACGVKLNERGYQTHKIEYETVAMTGSNLYIADRAMIIELDEILNSLGLDTISAGSVAAFATELVEKGLLNYPLKWGDVEGYKKLYHDIAYRRGVGNILAEGVAIASKHFNAEDFAIHIKGLEIPAYDPRGVIGMALAYATADRGGDHLRAWTVVAELTMKMNLEELVKLVIHLQNRNAALWTLVACDNIVGGFANPEEGTKLYVEMLNTLGYDYSYESFLRLGERIYTLTRLINVRDGIRRESDKLPKRFHEKREDTGWFIAEEDFEKMLDLYYSFRKWDSDGVPTPELVRSLGI